MKKGIILKIDKRYVTLLTPDGQFLRAHNLASDYQIGQEISFFPVKEENQKNNSLTRLFRGYKGKSIIITGIATIILIAGSLFPVYQRNQVYAYMSIDNGSSVELAVNKDLQVIEIIPYDKKGEAVLENLNDWKNKDLAVVSKNILNEMETQGYIDQEEILVSTVYKGDRNKEADNNLQQDISELKAHVKVEDKTLTVVNATTEERTKAKEQGITAGEMKQSSLPKKTDDSDKKDKKNKQSQKENSRIQMELSPGQLKKEQLKVPVEPPANPVQPEISDPNVEAPQQEIQSKANPEKQEKNKHWEQQEKNKQWQNEMQQKNKNDRENKNKEKNK